MTNQHIVIIGFMGSGKTTVALALARALNCRAIDLDSLITEREQRTPKEIIEQDGEDRFREIETQMLRKALLGESTTVIAAGGGAWTIAENRKMIAERGASAIWLDAPFELCWQRIGASGDNRPLAPSREMARKLYEERRPVYELAATRVVVSEMRSAEEIAKELANAGLAEVEHKLWPLASLKGVDEKRGGRKRKGGRGKTSDDKKSEQHY